MTDWEKHFITSHRVARLATVDAKSQPHIVPIVYAFDGQRLFTPIDEKPKSVDPYGLRRVRNIRVNPRVAVIIDDYGEDWTHLAWVQIRGRSALVESGADYESGLMLLTGKYPQYERMPLSGCPLIVIEPEQIRAWRADQRKG